ncbi:hypothetical protein KKE26_09260 [bacterium]|nr:hypothetical protein [bacterium]MBU1753719.1 hypothetical protein [bacterium]
MIERLRGLLSVRRQEAAPLSPVFAATIAFAIIILAFLFIHMPEQRQVLDMAAEDIVSLSDEGNGAICDFGTDIEKYFL